LNPLTFLGSALSPSCIALSSNEWGVVSVFDAAIMLWGNHSSSTVWLEKVMLTDNETAGDSTDLIVDRYHDNKIVKIAHENYGVNIMKSNQEKR
jgi:hypothetical protein